jgi:hypothetical protein
VTSQVNAAIAALTATMLATTAAPIEPRTFGSSSPAFNSA